MTRPRVRRARHTAAVGAALVTALTLVGCSADLSATLDGQPIDTAAGEISDELVGILGAVAAEFGEVDIDLIQLSTDHASLYYVDPSEPDTRQRTEFRDSIWSAPVGGRRPDTSESLPLGAVDPAGLRSAIEAAPGLLGIDEARLSHVSISPDESGRVEYLVALATGDSLGRVTFGPDGREREVRAPR